MRKENTLDWLQSVLGLRKQVKLRQIYSSDRPLRLVSSSDDSITDVVVDPVRADLLKRLLQKSPQARELELATGQSYDPNQIAGIIVSELGWVFDISEHPDFKGGQSG